MGKAFYVYVMANSNNAVLYIGVTSDLIKRVWQHREGLVEGFTKKYNCKKLVYFEVMLNPATAISREKQLKNWHRDWKLNLVKSINPKLCDLFDSILGTDPETSSG